MSPGNVAVVIPDYTRDLKGKINTWGDGDEIKGKTWEVITCRTTGVA